MPSLVGVGDHGEQPASLWLADRLHNGSHEGNSHSLGSLVKSMVELLGSMPSPQESPSTVIDSSACLNGRASGDTAGAPSVELSSSGSSHQPLS